MKTFTVTERKEFRSRSQAARYFLRRYYKRGKMTQSAIANRLGVSVACVNEVAKVMGLVGAR